MRSRLLKLILVERRVDLREGEDRVGFGEGEESAGAPAAQSRGRLRELGRWSVWGERRKGHLQ